MQDGSDRALTTIIRGVAGVEPAAAASGRIITTVSGRVRALRMRSRLLLAIVVALAAPAAANPDGANGFFTSGVEAPDRT